jgi:hypothetical protein
MDKVQIIDHSNTAPSSKTFRDEQWQGVESDNTAFCILALLDNKGNLLCPSFPCTFYMSTKPLILWYDIV